MNWDQFVPKGEFPAISPVMLAQAVLAGRKYSTAEMPVNSGICNFGGVSNRWRCGDWRAVFVRSRAMRDDRPFAGVEPKLLVFDLIVFRKAIL
jgi:hypothetical protein